MSLLMRRLGVTPKTITVGLVVRAMEVVTGSHLSPMDLTMLA